MRTPPPVSLIDSPLYGGTISDPRMREIFSVDAYIARITDVEVALARVQADLDVIPRWAADGIAAAAASMIFDMAELGRMTGIVGFPIVAIVKQLGRASGDAGKYLHWGATTQDIMDTACVLQIRAGLDLIESQLVDARAALRRLARDHRDTAMAGRTHLQQALPVTFGYKAAVWLSALDRHAERLAEIRPRVQVVQFSGAAGTLASLGDDGLDIQAGLARELGLGTPAITWHAARDTMTETVSLLAMIGGSLGKIAQDVALMMMSEIAEVSEPFMEHRGSSSTMPQKQNPISCEYILAAARMLREKSGLMLDAMIHDFERATGPWQLEWAAIPESFAIASGALAEAGEMLSGLQVFPNAMRRNLGLTRGLIVAEAVMMALAHHTGREAAHDLVYAGVRRCLAEDRALFDVLCEEPDVVGPLGKERLATLCDPANYLGQAPEMVDRYLADPDA